MSDTVALGFRAKTGRAIVVALADGSKGPRLLWRREASLVDPRRDATTGPYHEVMELPWEESLVAVQPLLLLIERAARTAVASLVREVIEGKGHVRAIGIVGSLDRPLQKIGNPHIRAHAAEGILFRRVIESAAEHEGIRYRTFSEKDIRERAAASRIASHLQAIGKAAGPPWRADERAAAAAAWLALQSADAKNHAVPLVR
ncbi:MAG TPA: hypothetical protein VLV78_10605 [Thermoanaerobaculia bacterium]|nr:hypothetical protein [Thermoanaerobaculia bacterium]